jgi:hypothetical protein
MSRPATPVSEASSEELINNVGTEVRSPQQANPVQPSMVSIAIQHSPIYQQPDANPPSAPVIPVNPANRPTYQQ